MSLVNPRQRVARAGDLVILHDFPSTYTYVHLEAGKTLQTRSGVFHHDDFINRPFGSRCLARLKGGVKSTAHTLIMLKPTAELWTLALKHRTQVLYDADVSLVCVALEIRNGSCVLEAGTGSGALSHALARAVAPSGKLYTVDFHETRAKTAKVEFEMNGVSAVVDSSCGDICAVPVSRTEPTTGSASTGNWMIRKDSDGLHAIAIQEDAFDAVFLDVPAPQRAVENVHRALKFGGVICTFSPCIEQVQKSCAAMRRLGFVDVRMAEVLACNMEIKKVSAVPMQIERKTVSVEALVAVENLDREAGKDDVDAAEDDLEGDMEGDSSVAVPAIGDEAAGKTITAGPRKRPAQGTTRVSRPAHDMHGHTGYLVFARKTNYQEEQK
nr:tRNA (adenine(58)-N(1))-methyltransferase catalytic subunit TRMT61A [Andalucia godoyi]